MYSNVYGNQNMVFPVFWRARTKSESDWSFFVCFCRLNYYGIPIIVLSVHPRGELYSNYMKPCFEYWIWRKACFCFLVQDFSKFCTWNSLFKYVKFNIYLIRRWCNKDLHIQPYFPSNLNFWFKISILVFSKVDARQNLKNICDTIYMVNIYQSCGIGHLVCFLSY